MIFNALQSMVEEKNYDLDFFGKLIYNSVVNDDHK